MKNKLLILVSGSVLAVAACAKHDEASTNTTDMNVAMDNGMSTNMGADMNSGMNATAEAGPMTAQGFANAAAASDKFEIESSKLASSSAKSTAVKSFATKMISAHTESTAKLKATKSGVTPDDTLSAEQQSTLDSLKGKTGADFDTAYAAAQVDGHQRTLDALKSYSTSGDNATLKSFASGMIPTVTAHLNMAKGLK